MISRRLALLILTAALMGCGAGRTIRVADEGDASGNQPVALAPAPAEEPDAGAAAAPAASPEPQPSADPPSAAAQGYAPYGNPRSLEVRRIGQWSHTGIGETRRLVIRDANAWAQFWSELGAGDRPEVDFTQDVVVAVAAGQRATGGHEVAISQVTETDGQLMIEVVETTPGPNCVTTASVTQPVDVVVLQGAAPRSWNFVERKEIRACR